MCLIHRDGCNQFTWTVSFFLNQSVRVMIDMCSVLVPLGYFVVVVVCMCVRVYLSAYNVCVRVYTVRF